MKKPFRLISLSRNFPLSALIGAFLIIFGPSMGRAQVCEVNDLEFIGTGGENLLVYWEESCGLDDAVKYRTSTDRGATWGGIQTLATSATVGVFEDFDGIRRITPQGRLVASFAVTEQGQAKLKVMTSDDFGQNWSAPFLVWNISTDLPNFSDFTGCPTLTTSYARRASVLALHTVIEESGITATAYIVRSLDQGATWELPQSLGPVPLLCDD